MGGSKLTGGCQCGAVRYQLAAAPTGASICHCRMCQKATGSPYGAYAPMARDALAFTRGAPKIFRSSEIAERGFCAECGTPLTYRNVTSQRISVTICSLDDPELAPPEVPARPRSCGELGERLPDQTRCERRRLSEDARRHGSRDAPASRSRLNRRRP